MYRIQEIKLKTGTNIEPGNLTVAIGPNNGGKSQFLKDLVSAISKPSYDRKAVDTITPVMEKGALHVARTIVQGAKREPNGTVILDRMSAELQPEQMRVGAEALRVLDADDEEYAARLVRDTLGGHLVAHLTTERRLMMVKRQSGKQQNCAGAQSVLEAMRIASDDDANTITAAVKEAFGTSLVFSDVEFPELEFCLSRTVPQAKGMRERYEELTQLEKLDDQGDGIRSFCGIVAAAALVSRPIIAIDEPEAFLHPPQAYLIGRAIGTLSGRGVQFFVATHSAEVLRGILSVTADTTIVRFAKQDEVFSSHVMDLAKLREITNDPMLSSARVLDGLFYTGVAITEADGDVVLYRTILEQMDKSASIGFVNSYSKGLSGRIAKAFMSAKVPCAVLVDFDMFRVRDEFSKLYVELGGEWKPLTAAFDNFTTSIDGIETADSRLAGALELLETYQAELPKQGDAAAQIEWLKNRMKDVKDRSSLWDRLKKQGRNALPEHGRRAYNFLNEQCERVGLFVTTEGDREAWLVPEIAFTKNKPHWTELALGRLAEGPLDLEHPLARYVRAFRAHCLGLMTPELEDRLSDLDTNVGRWREELEDDADFWRVFAAEADAIVDDAGDHGRSVRRAINEMLVCAKLVPPGAGNLGVDDVAELSGPLHTVTDQRETRA